MQPPSAFCICKQGLPSEFREMGMEPHFSTIYEKVIEKRNLILFLQQY